MENVEIKPKLIHWALKRSGLSVSLLKKDFPKLEGWEREGGPKPTFKQLERFAKKTYTPLGYFFLSEPPEDRLPIPDFRTVSSGAVNQPSPDLLETVQTMQRRQAWMREFLIEQGEEPIGFVGSVSLGNNPVETANRIREALKLNDGWAANILTWTGALGVLRIAIEEAKILTVFNGVVGNNTHRKLNVEEFRGFILADKYAPLIFVNGSDAKAAQMFTLAHELAHLWLGEGGVFNFRQLQPADNDVERFCDKVAAEFLVPAQLFLAQWKKSMGFAESFQKAARQFKVSPLVAARRALDLKFISKEAFFKFYESYMREHREKHKKTTGGDFFATQGVRIGKRFALAVLSAAKEGRLLYRDAYQLTGLFGSTFDKYAKTLGAQAKA